jgi:hypothetical protein
MKSMLQQMTCAGLLVFLAAALPQSLLGNAAAQSGNYKVVQHPDAVSIQAPDGSPMLRYQVQLPSDTQLSVESACYFHPVTTPGGLVMTDVAPADHLHHRGIFLAWVEMHGAKKADFWGWGEHAPKQGRRIENRAVVDLVGNAQEGGFTAHNDWMAEDAVVLKEQLQVSARLLPSAQVLDLTYTITPQTHLTLSQWAFSGFCVRLPTDGKVEAFSPDGPVAHPNPKHTDPKSNWPDAPWYDLTLRFEDGKTGGVAVINHPANPPTTWHNQRGIRMLNPCIVAPAEMKLDPRNPLVLRYRVVLHDGPLPKELLDKLSIEWRK